MGNSTQIICRWKRNSLISPIFPDDIHHVETRVIQVDFATGRLEDYLHVQAQLQGLDIGVLGREEVFLWNSLKQMWKILYYGSLFLSLCASE